MEDAQTYRVGWVIPGRVLGITHYTSTVGLDEIRTIIAEAGRLAAGATTDFYVILDHRNIANTALAPLHDMKAAAPYLNHTWLRQIVLIVPRSIASKVADLTDQVDDTLRLTHVATVAAALDYLRQLDATLNWDRAETRFFD